MTKEDLKNKYIEKIAEINSIKNTTRGVLDRTGLCDPSIEMVDIDKLTKEQEIYREILYDLNRLE